MNEGFILPQAAGFETQLGGGMIGAQAAMLAPITSGQPQGIDLSSHDGPVDLSLAYNAGIRFAWIKATEGTGYANPYFRQQATSAERAGILWGPYHYFTPGVSGTDQAAFFTRTVFAAFGPPHPGRLQPALDAEITRPGLPVRDLLAGYSAFLAWVRREHDNAGAVLYTYPYFWIKELGNPAIFGGSVPLWEASYGNPPPPLGGFPFASFWQWTSHGRVPGVRGGVGDCDRSVFNGDMARLLHFAHY